MFSGFGGPSEGLLKTIVAMVLIGIISVIYGIIKIGIWAWNACWSCL